MNITELNTQEKSVMLAKLCNIKFVSQEEHGNQFIGNAVSFNGDWLEGYHSTNIYIQDEMALAWRVLIWATDNQLLLDKLREDDFMGDIGDLPTQAAWLDKILSLAIEAGMVNDE